MRKFKFKLYEKEKVEYYILVYPNIEKVRGFILKTINMISFLMMKKEF